MQTVWLGRDTSRQKERGGVNWPRLHCVAIFGLTLCICSLALFWGREPNASLNVKCLPCQSETSGALKVCHRNNCALILNSLYFLQPYKPIFSVIIRQNLHWFNVMNGLTCLLQVFSGHFKYEVKLFKKYPWTQYRIKNKFNIGVIKTKKKILDKM